MIVVFLFFCPFVNYYYLNNTRGGIPVLRGLGLGFSSSSYYTGIKR